MKMTRALARAVTAAIVTGYAIAAAASTQVPIDRTITQIGAYGNIGYVVFTQAIPNLEGCPYVTGNQVIFDWTAVQPVWPDEHAAIDPFRHTGN